MSDQDYPSKVMEPAVYQPDLLTQSLYWIEPELPHKQVIVVTTDDGTLYHGRDGSHVHDWGVMLNPAKRQFRQLTQELHLQDAGKNWKGGAAFFCYIVPLEYGGRGPHFAIRMAMPMLDFIFPQDSKPQGLRVLALEQAFSSEAYPLLRLVPTSFIGKPLPGPQLQTTLPHSLAHWARAWGVESLLLVARDEHYAVDSTTALMRYTPSLWKMHSWHCAGCRPRLQPGDSGLRQRMVDYNVPGGFPLPACIKCGMTAAQSEDDDL